MTEQEEKEVNELIEIIVKHWENQCRIILYCLGALQVGQLILIILVSKGII